MNVMEMGHIETGDKRLTWEQKYRLLEIAHETKVPEIRKYALEVLGQDLFPPRFVAGKLEEPIIGPTDSWSPGT